MELYNKITPRIEAEKQKPTAEKAPFSDQEKNISEVFKLNPELKKAVEQAIGKDSDYADISIEFGRSKDSENLGKVQNINVTYKGELIIDSDTAVLNKSNIKLFIVTKEDGTSYVGDVALPENLRGKGLGGKILQKISNELDTKIIPTYLSTGGFTSDSAKGMWEKFGNEIVPDHEAEKLYAEYLKTIFPESKVKDVFYHGTASKSKIENFNFEKSNFAKAVFFTKDRKFAESFAFDDSRDGNVQEQILDIKNPFDFSKKEYIQELKPIIEELVKEGYKSENTNIIFRNDLPQINIGENEIQNPSIEDFVNHYIWRLENGSWRIIETDRVINFISKKYDSILINERGSTNIAVFNLDQIHILGSKADIEKFNEFVETQKNKPDPHVLD